MWDAQGALAQYLRALFGQKENFTVHFSRKGRSLLHPNTAQRSFFPLQSFSRKLQKRAQKARINTERVYRVVLMPPGNRIILPKSNKFNMAAVSVKRSIEATVHLQKRQGKIPEVPILRGVI